MTVQAGCHIIPLVEYQFLRVSLQDIVFAHADTDPEKDSTDSERAQSEVKGSNASGADEEDDNFLCYQ